MIELKNLYVNYDEREVLKDVSIGFPLGQVTVILGPNGCGKSTMIKTALGLLKKQSGKILIDGVEIESMRPVEIARKAAYLSQSRNIPYISVSKMVLHGRFPYLSFPRKYRKEDYRAVTESLIKADAYDLINRHMTELSGGQRQKVYLAMALAQDTETVFMDEPTTYLDIKHQLEVMSVARGLASQGKAAVLVLHDLGLALRGADSVAVMSKDGIIKRIGSPEDIFLSGVLDEVFEVKVHRVETKNGWQYYCEE